MKWRKRGQSVDETMVVSRKDIKKAVRSIGQGIVLITLLIVIIRALCSFNKYTPFVKADIDSVDNGFIAISYFGVDREGSDTLISTKRLEEHLRSLYNQGYVTITQEDIKAYYEKGVTLPEKALYLMFEDGRRDTAIFAQKIMEKYNFKATMMSYAERCSDNQSKFLSIDDLKEIEESTYWELGTNGYRLSYINVYDKEEEFIGELTSLEYSKMKNQLGRNYNHYLMDFIRDEDGVPTESRSQMEERITWDYDQIEKIYTEGLGYLPQTYVLMHSNTGAFGNNDKVSQVNGKCLEELFAMNFNREGDCYNVKDTSIYDLTRMQPQSYWYTNHLLMRIKYDTDSDVTFISGEEDMTNQWNVEKGALEYQNEKYIVTSEPKKKGRISLKDVSNLQDFYLHTVLTGNKIGEQTIYLRKDDMLTNYIAVTVKDNFLYITESIDGIVSEVEMLDLAKVDGITTDTKWDIKDLGKRELDIYLQGENLTMVIDNDGYEINQKVSYLGAGGIALQSGWSDYGWSQRNLADDVYDGVFEQFYIMDIAQESTFFEGRYTGFEAVKYEAKKAMNEVINWFIKYL